MLGKKDKLSRSSQAALEFLMTYGWAVLVMVISVSVLAYFGVLNLDQFFPEKCSLPYGIICLDHRVESYRVVIVLQNVLGKAITIDKVLVSGNNQQCFDNQSIALKNDEKAIFTIAQCNNGAEGKKFEGAVNVTYTIENELTHIVAGILKSKIVGGLSVSSQNICQNAQNYGLCNGLDIVFGEGYKSACCSEYSLCC